MMVQIKDIFSSKKEKDKGYIYDNKYCKLQSTRTKSRVKIMPPHIFIYLFLFYRQPHIFIFHLVCYISKCLRVETSFWTGGCTHTPAKCQSSYMRKKCIASNLITTCRILIKKKKKNFSTL